MKASGQGPRSGDKNNLKENLVINEVGPSVGNTWPTDNRGVVPNIRFEPNQKGLDPLSGRSNGGRPLDPAYLNPNSETIANHSILFHSSQNDGEKGRRLVWKSLSQGKTKRSWMEMKRWHPRQWSSGRHQVINVSSQ